jgi:hypothetical protein
MTGLGGSRNLPPGPVIISPAAVQAQVPALGVYRSRASTTPSVPMAGALQGARRGNTTPATMIAFPNDPAISRAVASRQAGRRGTSFPAIACTSSRVKAVKVPGVAQQARRAYKR